MYDSSEWVDELQLLVSEGNSLEGQGGKDDASFEDGRGGGRGRGGGGGGAGKAGGGGGGAGRLGWKPLHFRIPFVRVRERSNDLRVSTLSRDFVLPRFFYEKNTTEGKIIFKHLKESKD